MFYDRYWDNLDWIIGQNSPESSVLQLNTFFWCAFNRPGFGVAQISNKDIFSNFSNNAKINPGTTKLSFYLKRNAKMGHKTHFEKEIGPFKKTGAFNRPDTCIFIAYNSVEQLAHILSCAESESVNKLDVWNFSDSETDSDSGSD